MWGYAYNRRAVSLPASKTVANGRREVKGGKVQTASGEERSLFCTRRLWLVFEYRRKNHDDSAEESSAPISNEALQQRWEESGTDRQGKSLTAADDLERTYV